MRRAPLCCRKTLRRWGGYSKLDVGPRELLRAVGAATCDEDVEPLSEVIGPQVPFRID